MNDTAANTTSALLLTNPANVAKLERLTAEFLSSRPEATVVDVAQFQSGVLACLLDDRDALAAEIVEWHDREWFDVRTGEPKSLEMVALKFAEESGEVAGAVIKLLEQRSGDDWLAEARKELGDALVVATTLASRLADIDGPDADWSLAAVRADRFESVRHRRSSDYR